MATKPLRAAIINAQHAQVHQQPTWGGRRAPMLSMDGQEGT